MVKNLPVNTGDLGLIPGSGRFPGEGDGNPLQHSCLGNPMDRGAGRLHSMGSGSQKSDATKQQNCHPRPNESELPRVGSYGLRLKKSFKWFQRILKFENKCKRVSLLI